MGFKKGLVLVLALCSLAILTGCGDKSAGDVQAPATTPEDRIKAIEASNASRETKDIQISMIKNSQKMAPAGK